MDDTLVNLEVWDTAGQDDLGKLRAMAYNNADVFIICFSLVNRDSFEKAYTKWKDEVTALGPRCSLVLVGTKGDLKKAYE